MPHVGRRRYPWPRGRGRPAPDPDPDQDQDQNLYQGVLFRTAPRGR